ncbi:agmatine deiminase family protein [Methylacidiphilum caldifontis]|uniref:Peptidyl-arginine deiminase n=1 Tax=Methylacidiphilum caldifontis TaxID=2795386 RepID=A0A4Y8PA43_9BACT|nr:agmatine deiminase family protein [Methylacidiphilum caldifontis]TFE67401.1 peptidyl-arginine deiminase [Methylacidiphilum caldifontis]
MKKFPIEDRTQNSYLYPGPEFRLPAEWEKHKATWFTWPRKQSISFPGIHREIEELWIKLIRVISGDEQVRINVFDRKQYEEVEELIKERGGEINRRIFLYENPAYEPWCRDHGPIFIKNDREIAIVDFGYNAWGGKYPPYDLDDQVPQRIGAYLGMRVFSPALIVEGGAIDSNGQGVLLASLRSIVNPNRNPEISLKSIEEIFHQFLGADKVIWLEAEIVGDDTDGHVDQYSRFLNTKTIAAAFEENSSDSNYKSLCENIKRLAQARDSYGKFFEIVEIPMPKPIIREGMRLPASYLNFYFTNHSLFVPVFNDSKDEKVLEILQGFFPERKIYPFPARDLVWGLGAIHCITQQEPGWE